jgi:hypothetical protein
VTRSRGMTGGCSDEANPAREKIGVEAYGSEGQGENPAGGSA